MLLKDRFIEVLLKAYPSVAERQTEEGWFAYDGNKYTMYSQYAGVYLAWLYTFGHPANAYFGNSEILERAQKVWDHYGSMINEEGLYHIISGNQDYGYSLDEWGLFYWMKSAELLRPHLPVSKLAEWDGKLRCIAQKLCHMIRYPERLDHDHGYNFRRNFSYHTSNHYIWCLLAIHTYGKLYGDAGAMETAAELMDEVIGHQLPSGCWLECGTPTVHYNEVSLSAISYYEHNSGSERASKAVRKGLDYALNTTYPDFTRIETLDGRNRYRRRSSELCVPTYSAYTEGRALLSRWIDQNDKMNSFTQDNLHGLANVTVMLGAIAGDAQYACEDIRNYIPSCTDFPELKARVHREHGWVIPFCCLEQKEYGNCYVLYRQNLISIYHEKSGLLIGGGNSIAQPQFSCFNIITRDKLHYMHENGSILGEGAGMSLVYGGAHCTVKVSGITDTGLSVIYTVDGLSDVDRAYVHIPLVGQLGDIVDIAGEQTEWGRQSTAQEIAAGKPVRFRSAAITLSEGASYDYPVFPYNSYLQKQQKNFNEVFGIITVELDYKRPAVEMKIRIV